MTYGHLWADRLPVHQDQLCTQRSVSSMGSIYLFLLHFHYCMNTIAIIIIITNTTHQLSSHPAGKSTQIIVVPVSRPRAFRLNTLPKTGKSAQNVA